MRVKLTKKLALVLNGFDLSPYKVGEEFSCSPADGRMIVQEGWAQPVNHNGHKITVEPPHESILAIIDRLRDGLKER